MKGNARLKYGEKWNRQETILAFELYCRIPFRLTKRTTPEVIELAGMIGRTPSSVARKLGNFGSFDPKLQEQGISGLANASKLDREVWDSFKSDWETLVYEADSIKQRLTIESQTSPIASDSAAFANLPSATEVVRTRRERVGQQFFRESVLSSFNSRCCITGLNVPECLIASHIVPWSVRSESRLDPSNGFCLSATIDRLFDRFQMTIKQDFTVQFSSHLRQSNNSEVRRLVSTYDGATVAEPDRFKPKPEYLGYHNDVFKVRS